jgi:hypothetical protein
MATQGVKIATLSEPYVDKLATDRFFIALCFLYLGHIDRFLHFLFKEGNAKND